MQYFQGSIFAIYQSDQCYQWKTGCVVVQYILLTTGCSIEQLKYDAVTMCTTNLKNAQAILGIQKCFHTLTHFDILVVM